MIVFIAVLLLCCSLLLIVRLPLLTRSENLSRPEPQSIGKSTRNMENRLPYYTAGFE